jgi:hypothetical protein
VVRRTARFPGVLYLDPEPADGLRQLTLAIAGRWPKAPPYGGAFDEVIPHLTVAHSVADGLIDEIDAAVLQGLPISTRLVGACLYVFDGAPWQLRTWLSFTVVATRDSRSADMRQVLVPFEHHLMGYTIRYRWARLTFELVRVGAPPPTREESSICAWQRRATSNCN